MTSAVLAVRVSFRERMCLTRKMIAIIMAMTAVTTVIIAMSDDVLTVAIIKLPSVWLGPLWISDRGEGGELV